MDRGQGLSQKMVKGRNKGVCRSFSAVMAGLVPAIHVLLSCCEQDVDARNECGHDGLNEHVI